MPRVSLRQCTHGARRALCICVRVRTTSRPMPPTRILSPFDVRSSSTRPSCYSAPFRLRRRDSNSNLQRSRTRHPLSFSPIQMCHSRGSRSCAHVLLKTLPSIPVPRAIWHADRSAACASNISGRRTPVCSQLILPSDLRDCTIPTLRTQRKTRLLDPRYRSVPMSPRHWQPVRILPFHRLA